MRIVCEGDCKDCVPGRQRTYPLLGVFSVSCGPYLSAAECCGESYTCVKFPTRLFLENRPRLIFLYVLLCSYS